MGSVSELAQEKGIMVKGEEVKIKKKEGEKVNHG